MLGLLRKWHLRGIFAITIIFTVFALSALFSVVKADTKTPAEVSSNSTTAVPELDTDVTPLSGESLVNSVLGGDITAADITAKGTIYTFTHGLDLVGIDSGIILETSGRITNEAKDPDLEGIMDYSYGGDTAMLEFTILATGKLLNFNYVFVSTEFDQDPKFNDNFGLFVSVNGGAYENIATIHLATGAQTPININNLRSGINANGETTRSSISVETSAHNYQQHSLFNSAPININNSIQPINGVSNVFNAQKIVEPGDIVKIKFAIADVSDKAYDSYVLIEADSLSFEEQLARIDYSREVIEKLYSGRNYEITTGETTYVFASSSNGEIPLAGTDQTGQDYDFMGEDIAIVRKGIGALPDSNPQYISVDSRPTTPPFTVTKPSPTNNAKDNNTDTGTNSDTDTDNDNNNVADTPTENDITDSNTSDDDATANPTKTSSDATYTTDTSDDAGGTSDDPELLIPDTSNPLAPDTGEMEKTLGTAKTCAVSTIALAIFSALIAAYATMRLNGLRCRIKNQK